MRLKKLEIVNFRFIKNQTFEIPTDKKVVVFSGKNGIGKSTILDAILWLLCDETLVYGCQNSENLDKSDRKTPIDVCATFIKDNGEELKLRRTLTPKFSRTGEFSKYETLLQINDADYTVKQYFARIKNEELGIYIENDPDVSSFNTLRSILDYNYLNYIDYKVARNKIEKLLKITKDEELVNSPEYSLIRDDLKAQLYDVAKVKTKLNKQKDVADNYLKILNRDYENLKNAYKPLDYEELEKIENSKKIISEKEYEHSVEYKSALQKNEQLSKELKLAFEEYTIKENNYNAILKNYKDTENSKKYYENEINNLRETFISVKNSTTKCPKCNYELNGDEIRKRLNDINDKGAKAKKNIDELTQKLEDFDIKTAENNYLEAKKKYNEVNKSVEETSNKLKELINKEDSQSKIFYNEKAQKLSELEGQIANIKAQSNISGLESKESELKIARQELAKVEQKIAVIKDFEIAKNKAINVRINEVFPNLDFRLYEESDTGAISNTCKVYLKNVGFEGVNTGHKILLGLEVINSLRKVLGMKETLPIIFDDVNDLDKTNFEKIVKESNNQIITTYVNNSEKIEMNTI